MKKRSFKIATAFAGAAVATMGLGPAALAATARPASGSIRNQRCSQTPLPNGISHWVHIYYPTNSRGKSTHVPECFGYKGFTPAQAYVWSACPGNNIGGLYFANANPYLFNASGGKHSVKRFGPIQQSASLVSVSIRGWRSHATCPSY